MSATKNNPAFDRMMEEARLNDDLNDERYSEELYLNGRKAALPKETDPYPNVHDKVGTKEDIFGMMGRIFGHNK